MDHELLSSRLFDVPVSLVVFLSIAYGAVSLAAVIGNSAVLWIVFRSHRLRTVTNVFIANLAFADILIGALAIPFQFVAALLQRWILPHFMCPFCTVVQIVSVNVSIFTLAAIAAERYLIVSHLLHCRISKKRAKGILLIIWIVALMFASPAGIALQVTLVPDMDSKALEVLMTQDQAGNLTLPFKYQCENRGLDPLLWKWYNRILVLIQYIIPVCVLLFAYGKMGMLLRGPSRSPPANSSGKLSQNQAQLSDRSPSPNETSRGPGRSASDIELSNQSNPRLAACSGGSSQKTDVPAVGADSAALPPNSEYIAANKKRVSSRHVHMHVYACICSGSEIANAYSRSSCSVGSL